jgi:hypothetical protein
VEEFRSRFLRILIACFTTVSGTPGGGGSAESACAEYQQLKKELLFLLKICQQQEVKRLKETKERGNEP